MNLRYKNIECPDLGAILVAGRSVLPSVQGMNNISRNKNKISSCYFRGRSLTWCSVSALLDHVGSNFRNNKNQLVFTSPPT